MTTMRRQEYSTDFRAYLSNNKHTIIYICVHIYISTYMYVHTSSSRMQMHHVYVQIIEGKNNCPIYMNRLYHIGPLVTVKKCILLNMKTYVTYMKTYVTYMKTYVTYMWPSLIHAYTVWLASANVTSRYTQE